jgi:hypothetical protein
MMTLIKGRNMYQEIHAYIKISKTHINICFSLHPKIFRYIVVLTVIRVKYLHFCFNIT